MTLGDQHLVPSRVVCLQELRFQVCYASKLDNRLLFVRKPRGI